MATLRPEASIDPVIVFTRLRLDGSGLKLMCCSAHLVWSLKHTALLFNKCVKTWPLVLLLDPRLSYCRASVIGPVFPAYWGRVFVVRAWELPRTLLSSRQVRNPNADGPNVSVDTPQDDMAVVEPDSAAVIARPSSLWTSWPVVGLTRFVMAAPVAMAVALMGVLLTLVAFFGVRALEDSRAEVAYERTVLDQTTNAQSRLANNIRLADSLATFLTNGGPIPSSSVFDNYFLGTKLFETGSDLDGVVYAAKVDDVEGFAALKEREIARENDRFNFQFNPLAQPTGGYVITRAFGAADREARMGDLLQSGMTGAVQEATETGSTVFRLDTQAQNLFPITDPGFSEDEGFRSVNGLVLVTPVLTSGTDPVVRGALITRLNLGALLAGVQDGDTSVGLEIMLNDRPVATTVSADERGTVLGEPAKFTQNDATIFAVQGYRVAYQIPRNQSSAVLTGGLALSFVLAWVGRATREHALTLGRLERSEHDARHDPLTGLLNRAGLTIGLSRRVEARKPPEMVGVLFLDLDRLKIINDSIGHTAGDEVLAVVANRLREVTEPDDVIGRFGGDEFVIVPAQARAVRDLTRIADAIIEALSEACVLSDSSLQMISASIGIAWIADGEATAESMLRDADVAMYQAKDSGGNSWVVFDAELREQALHRLEVERELRRAIAEGQLVVHYQPIVSTTDGSVNKLEALVRWKHPVRGLIPPGQFLTVAEETGLIVAVGEHVLREACRQAARWSAICGRSISVSVNVAERQLIDPALVKTVRTVLNEAGLNASQLELEITEELIVERLDRRLTVLRQLSRMGVKLAIDDFGTGRASLSQLRHLDMVDTLKVDRAFVENVATNETDQKILTAIVALAKSVGMETVAEGVEDADQATQIRAQGLDFIQGFFFHRPSDAAAILDVLRTPFPLPWGNAFQQSLLADQKL